MAETPTPTTSDSAKPAKEKKSLWETTITSTPVIMTVIATLFAGMSASEMTWAQYHRATAAQHQSKAGDQWNYFQAKKIRGTSMEMTSTLLRALSEPGHFDAAALQQSAGLLADTAKRTEQDLNRVVEAARLLNSMAGAGDAKPDSNLVRLQKSAESALTKARAVQDQAGKLHRQTEELLAKNKDELNEAFGHLQAGLPKAPRVTPADDPVLNKYADDLATLGKAVEERKSAENKELAPLLRHVPPEILRANYELAVKNTAELDIATGKLKQPFGTISSLVQKQLDLVRVLDRAVGELNRALPPANPDETKGLKDIRATAVSLTQTDRSIKDSVEQLYRDQKAASIDFDSRRYNEESKCTQAEARAYELLVLKSNFESDRHMHRKTFLFYAMLTAQAGVTIATLAMALKRHSTVWGLAAMAGAAAVGFGGFVALTM